MPETRTSTVSHSVPFWGEPGSLPVKRKVIIYFHIFFYHRVYLGCQTSYLKFSPGFSPTVHCTFPPSISIHCALPWKLFLEISSEIRKIFNIFSKQILCVFTSPKSKYRWHWIWNATFECFQESGIEPADFRLLKGFPFCHVSFNSSSRWGDGGSTHPKMIWRYHFWVG